MFNSKGALNDLLYSILKYSWCVVKYVKCYSESDNTQELRTFSVYTKHNTSQTKRSYLGTRKVLKLGGTRRNLQHSEFTTRKMGKTRRGARVLRD